MPAAKVERLAREFAANAPAVAIIGGAPLAHTNGLFNAVAVNTLNRVAGSVNQPGGVLFIPTARAGADAEPLARFSQGDAPKVLLLDDVNPVLRIAGVVEGRRCAEADSVHRQLRIVHR